MAGRDVMNVHGNSTSVGSLHAGSGDGDGRGAFRSLQPRSNVHQQRRPYLRLSDSDPLSLPVAAIVYRPEPSFAAGRSDPSPAQLLRSTRSRLLSDLQSAPTTSMHAANAVQTS
jgi:hypothetical protein